MIANLRHLQLESCPGSSAPWYCGSRCADQWSPTAASQNPSLLVIGGHDVDRPHPADPAAMRHANHATTAARAQQRLRRMVGLIFALASLLPWAVFAVLVARGLFALAAAARSH